MAADSAGNDVTAVGLPVTGTVAAALASAVTTLPTPTELADTGLSLPVAYKKLGLLTTDGGPEWTMEPDGDAIEFFQMGYSIPSGLAKCELVVTLAQTDATIVPVIYGKTPDANGYFTIDAGGHSTVFCLYEEVIFKNGVIRRRIVGNATVSAVKEVKAERGAVLGYQVTFKIDRDSRLNNEHVGQCLLPAA